MIWSRWAGNTGIGDDALRSDETSFSLHLCNRIGVGKESFGGNASRLSQLKKLKIFCFIISTNTYWPHTNFFLKKKRLQLSCRWGSQFLNSNDLIYVGYKKNTEILWKLGYYTFKWDETDVMEVQIRSTLNFSSWSLNFTEDFNYTLPSASFFSWSLFWICLLKSQINDKVPVPGCSTQAQGLNISQTVSLYRSSLIVFIIHTTLKSLFCGVSVCLLERV